VNSSIRWRQTDIRIRRPPMPCRWSLAVQRVTFFPLARVGPTTPKPIIRGGFGRSDRRSQQQHRFSIPGRGFLQPTIRPCACVSRGRSAKSPPTTSLPPTRHRGPNAPRLPCWHHCAVPAALTTALVSPVGGRSEQADVPVRVLARQELHEGSRSPQAGGQREEKPDLSQNRSARSSLVFGGGRRPITTLSMEGKP
jgi:hypothetical protein